MSESYSGRELHAAGHLLLEWQRAAAEDNLTGEERLNTLAAFLRAILDHGGGTWMFPPLPAAAAVGEEWQWQCAGCHRPTPPMGMCETCGVFGIQCLTEIGNDVGSR